MVRRPYFNARIKLQNQIQKITKLSFLIVSIFVREKNMPLQASIHAAYRALK